MTAGQGHEQLVGESKEAELERLLGEAKINEAELEGLLGDSNDEVMELRGKLKRAEDKQEKPRQLSIFVVVSDRTRGQIHVPNIPKNVAQAVAMASDLMQAARLILAALK